MVLKSPSLSIDGVIQKRKCGDDIRNPTEGCGKTLTKIHDTIPHTRIDMGYRDI